MDHSVVIDEVAVDGFKLRCLGRAHERESFGCTLDNHAAALDSVEPDLAVSGIFRSIECFLELEGHVRGARDGHVLVVDGDYTDCILA